MSGDLPQTGSYDFTALADLNADGFLDIAAIENETIGFWLGDGLGNWTFETSVSLDPTADAKAFRLGGDFDNNGHPDLVLLAEEGTWFNYNNYMYCFKENSLADSLWIKPQFPKGNENFYPGSVQFIEWASEVPAGESSTVNIEISAFGPEGPWWMLAEDLPNNGKHQWTVPDFGSDQVYLKCTVNHESGSATAVTQAAFNIFGNPTAVSDEINKPDVFLYPNPGFVFFMIHHAEQIQNIALMDVAGKICYQSSHPMRNNSVRHLSPGVYFYKIIRKDGRTMSGKWIKMQAD
jgi:hypothetical protein